MREILFRGKRIDGKYIDGSVWTEGYYVGEQTFVEKTCHWLLDINATKPHSHYYYSVDPLTVGQYTGLTDKNGKKIFEGDILKEDDVLHNGETQIKGRIGTCSFEKGCWVILFKDTWVFLQTNINVCSVIGNIHDNPELLKSRS